MPVPNLANLPMPVNSRGNSAKRSTERKEISMKLKIDKKVDPVRQWQGLFITIFVPIQFHEKKTYFT